MWESGRRDDFAFLACSAPDIFSFHDLALVRGVRMLYHHSAVSKKLFETYRARFSPYGSVASLYLWAVAGGALPERRIWVPLRGKRGNEALAKRKSPQKNKGGFGAAEGKRVVLCCPAGNIGKLCRSTGFFSPQKDAMPAGQSEGVNSASTVSKSSDARRKASDRVGSYLLFSGVDGLTRDACLAWPAPPATAQALFACSE